MLALKKPTICYVSDIVQLSCRTQSQLYHDFTISHVREGNQDVLNNKFSVSGASFLSMVHLLTGRVKWQRRQRLRQGQQPRRHWCQARPVEWTSQCHLSASLHSAPHASPPPAIKGEVSTLHWSVLTEGSVHSICFSGAPIYLLCFVPQPDHLSKMFQRCPCQVQVMDLCISNKLYGIQ